MVLHPYGEDEWSATGLFTNDLDAGVEGMIIKFADDSKLIGKLISQQIELGLNMNLTGSPSMPTR